MPMIRLLHLADLHIGMENYGRINAASGLHTRLLDYLERLDEAIAFGLQEQVDLVLIAGDIYKNRTPNPTHQREFARRIGRLRAEGIPVFILTGNHDMSPSAGRAHSVEIFNTLAIDGVTIADRPKLHTVSTRSGPLQIIALPWITRQLLLTRDETRMASFGEIEALMRQRVEVTLERFVGDLARDIPAVLACHGTIDGAQPGAERGITLGSDMVLPRSMIAQDSIDYVAMGHIHRHQALGQHPPIVYAGSIERVDFGERNEEKGCVLVELEKGATRWHFHPLQARPFVSIEVDVRKNSDPQKRIIVAIQKHNLQQAVVRIEVKATREQADLIDERAIREQIEAEAFLLAAFVVDVEREQRSRFAGEEQELLDRLSPRLALDRYLQATKREPERIAALLQAFDELSLEE
jgi:DNA repair protein SbcD/Mre11